MDRLTPAVIILTDAATALATQIAAVVGAEVHGLSGRTNVDIGFDSTVEHIAALFAARRPVIGICASGILIRAVAPLLNDKWAEPPVIAVSEDGRSVVPLLGGHHGANAMARDIAAAIDGAAAVTTAGDTRLGIALDEPPAGWRLANPDNAGAMAAAMLAGATPVLTGRDAPDLSAWLGVTATLTDTPGASLTHHDLSLRYYPRTVTLGVGSARDCPAQELSDLVEATLADEGVAQEEICAVASLDLKADEPAMLALAQRLGVPLRLFDAAALEAEAPRLATPSDIVFAEVGCHGVAEGAALALGGAEAALIRPKQKSANATCALARTTLTGLTRDLPGRARGRVSLVGIGPGQAGWRTPEASRLIAEADELVGYGLYIDLLGPLARGKPRADFPLGGEEARCRHALERAGTGKDVALICSGDAGIYAMGALVFELLDRGDLPDAARRVEVITAPGVSALQAAAARAGAPLGHDFCAISLSDLLTPTEVIRQRIRAAAQGDFVIAFYNPVSQRRRTLLAEAREILLTARPEDTPVLLARSLGRADENLSYRRLADLDVDEVDMMTVVLVRSSASRLASTGTGPRMYTPRGYAKKMEAAE